MKFIFFIPYIIVFNDSILMFCVLVYSRVFKILCISWPPQYFNLKNNTVNLNYSIVSFQNHNHISSSTLNTLELICVLYSKLPNIIIHSF